MGVFLSSFRNRIDRKGRVSVPAPFRAVLGGDANGIVVFRSLHHDALDACAPAHLETLSNSLEQLDLNSDVYDLVETTIFGGSQFLSIDSEGRVILPPDLMQAVGIDSEVMFVGRRRTFQLWEPKRFAAHETAARSAARAHDISLSKIIAAGQLKTGST